MLSKVIKDRIEQRFGQPVRYPKDCEALAAEIYAAVKCRISASTIERLFGFSHDTKQPRLYTLDVVSRYLGHDRWEQLLRSLDGQPETGKGLDHVASGDLAPGDVLTLRYDRDGVAGLRCLGNGDFEVTGPAPEGLAPGDTLAFSSVRLHYPLFAKSRQRGNVCLGGLGGITHIGLDKGTD